MQTAISYSTRAGAPSLKVIDPSEVRIPSLEELRARRDRLWFGISPILVGDSEEKPNDISETECEPIKNGGIFLSEIEAFVNEVPCPDWMKTERILQKIAEAYSVTVSDLRGKQKKGVWLARRHAIYALFVLRPEMTRTAIGRVFGTDHSSVRYAINEWAAAHGLPGIVYK